MRVTVESWVLVELVKLAAKAARNQDDLAPIDAAMHAISAQADDCQRGQLPAGPEALITSEHVI